MISILVPALNEEKNLPSTINNIIEASKLANITEIDIIIVDDGSKDDTPKVIEQFKKHYSFIRSLTHKENMGLGYSLRETIFLAKYDKFLIVPGDNDLSVELIKALFVNKDKADLVMSYFLNREIRGRKRNVISTLYNTIYMITFGIFVQYINGPCAFSSSIAQSLDLKAKRFSIAVELIIKMMRTGCTYYEIGDFLQKGLEGSTSLSFKNLIEVIHSYFRLFYEVKFLNKDKYKFFPSRVYR